MGNEASPILNTFNGLKAPRRFVGPREGRVPALRDCPRDARVGAALEREISVEIDARAVRLLFVSMRRQRTQTFALSVFAARCIDVVSN